MNLSSTSILDFGCKILTKVELPGYKSNQHEFNIPKSTQSLFDPDFQGRHFAHFHFLASNSGIVSIEFVEIYYYNARISQARRSAEYRLYYSPEIDKIISQFSPRDLAVFVKDLDRVLHIILCARKHESFSTLLEQCKGDNINHSLFPSQSRKDTTKDLFSDSFKVYFLETLVKSKAEPRGTKADHWHYSRISNRLEFLHKRPRPKTGELWIEKICADLAALTNIQHARQLLCKDKECNMGVLSFGFTAPTPPRTKKKLRKAMPYRSSTLIEGNRILSRTLINYNKEKRYHQTAHTLDNIIDSVRLITEDNTWQLLLQYFLFDCWIGNTDRHHENWGLIEHTSTGDITNKPIYKLAPTYDHGAALGSTQLPESKELILKNNSIGLFYSKGRSAIYPDTGSKKPLSFQQLIRSCLIKEKELSGSAKYCLAIIKRIHEVTPFKMTQIVSRVPHALLTDADREFTIAYLTHSKSELLSAAKAISGMES